MPRALDQLRHDPRLPALGESYFSVVPPAPLPQPRLVAFNPDAAALIDLDPRAAQGDGLLQVMAGNAPLPGGVTLSVLYAGHQFGVYVPQLGDGRAILIGQVRNEKDE